LANIEKSFLSESLNFAPLTLKISHPYSQITLGLRRIYWVDWGHGSFGVFFDQVLPKTTLPVTGSIQQSYCLLAEHVGVQ
jgi:hypothetical protein